MMKHPGGAKANGSASDLISQRIAELGDWRGDMLGRLRKLIKQADPDIVEEWKWMGTPVFSHAGIVCTGETYKSVVKMTFAKGAALKDPSGLFNSSLDGNVRRAIDIRENETLNEPALKALIREAVALNVAGKAGKPGKATTSKPKPKPESSRAPASQAKPPKPTPRQAAKPSTKLSTAAKRKAR